MLQMPRTAQQWLTIEEGFRDTFPHCIGAIDAKKIIILYPNKTPCKSSDILLLTFIDSDYRFLFADIDYPGLISDSGMLQNNLLLQKNSSNSLNLPLACPLMPGKNINVPYVFVGDEAFALSYHVMRPFPEQDLSSSVEKIFNKKLSSARLVVENVFGVFSSVFRVFQKSIAIDVENVKLITMSCILLHNFLIKSDASRNIYTPTGTFDTIKDGVIVKKGSWRSNYQETHGLRPARPISCESSTQNVLQIRSEFANYFQNFAH